MHAYMHTYIHTCAHIQNFDWHSSMRCLSSSDCACMFLCSWSSFAECACMFYAGSSDCATVQPHFRASFSIYGTCTGTWPGLACVSLTGILHCDNCSHVSLLSGTIAKVTVLSFSKLIIIEDSTLVSSQANTQHASLSTHNFWTIRVTGINVNKPLQVLHWYQLHETESLSTAHRSCYSSCRKAETDFHFTC